MKKAPRSGEKVETKRRVSSTKTAVKTSKSPKAQSGPSPLKTKSGTEADSPLKPLGVCSSQDGHGHAAETPAEKINTLSPASADVVPKVDDSHRSYKELEEIYNQYAYTDDDAWCGWCAFYDLISSAYLYPEDESFNESDNSVYPGINLKLNTTDRCLIAAFKLFCDPTAAKKVTEDVVIYKRQQFIVSFQRKRFDTGWGQSQQLLELLQSSMFAISTSKLICALERQNEIKLTHYLCSDREMKAFLDSQREKVKSLVIKKALKSLSLHDERKKIKRAGSHASSDTLTDDMKLDLLLFCYRRNPSATIDSRVLKTIKTENSELWNKWRVRLREENKWENKKAMRAREEMDDKQENKKDGKKVKTPKGPFHIGGVLKLTRMETWLYEFWTDPRFPLCGLDFPNIYNAAKVSQELLCSPFDPKSELRPGMTEESIRTVISRSKLERTPTPIATNIHRKQDEWPHFAFKPVQAACTGRDKWVTTVPCAYLETLKREFYSNWGKYAEVS